MSRLLLHCCCGPCAEYPIEFLRREARYEELKLLYFNPNIHPLAEWERRLESLSRLAQLRQLPLTVEEANWQARWEAIGDRPERCLFCYQVRMEEAARCAQKGGFEAFTSSLLVSPYQNREAILAAGERAAQRFGVKFLPYDFREGFREGQAMARADGLYRQKYCGCIFSLEQSDFREKILRQQAEWAAARTGGAAL